jgi:D-beta-D-heptose 7-phosphate kinase/D-beta-D-heptose 1-phosphate adenosyltransferase
MGKILVIGESCKDIFVYCNAQRLAPDIPVPVLDVEYITENPGMAMNVKNNIEKLTSDCEIVTNDNWEDITKTRYVHEQSNHTFIRIDSKFNPKPLNLKIEYSSYDLLVISDYNKGYVTNQKLFEVVDTCNVPIFIDSKKTYLPDKENCFIKINDLEYSKLDQDCKIKNLIVTKGGEGCLYNNTLYPAEKVKVYDVAGAGDTFLAALVYGYLHYENIEKAILLANKAAAVAVQNQGTYVLTEEDVKQFFGD